MKLQVVNTGAREHKETKLTCTTCKLKKCIGRCNWKHTPVRSAA